MVDPQILEIAVEEIRSNLSNIHHGEEARKVEEALTLLREQSALDPDDQMPHEVEPVLTDEEIEHIHAYLADIEEEIDRLYEQAQSE